MARTTGTNHRLMERLWQGDAVVSEELHLQMRQGTELVVLLCTDVVGPDEEARWIGSEAMNTTGRLQLDPDLTSLAFQDPLTGLANRRAVEYQETRHPDLAERHDTHVGMIFLDLGRFEATEDRFGHLAADTVLTEAARRLEAGVRKADVVALVGSDEFLILLPDVTDLGDVMTVAHRMEREIVSPITGEETEISVQAEMGIALFPDHGSSLEEFVQAADRAMYRARKNRGEFGDRLVSVFGAESSPDSIPTVEDRPSETGRGAGPSQAM
jgi:diguanylate cyclase (GGDEF)-like protein